ncbi:hypothetical protein A9Q87_00420, partial [Flavobacteriales bacterium 34_180_T64]
MKPLYVKWGIAFFLLISLNVLAQIRFVEDVAVTIVDVSIDDTKFTDIDGDNDMDVLSIGLGDVSTLISKLDIKESRLAGIGAFVTTWETTAVNQSITIPTITSTGEVYNYDVDWGDGNITNGALGDTSHTYLATGTYQVTITGLFPRIYFQNASVNTQTRIKSIDNWGSNPWTSMSFAFLGCSNLVVNATDTPDLSNVTQTEFMFDDCTLLGLGTGNWNWDTSTIIDMNSMFSFTANFNIDISSWDTSSTQIMSNLFTFSGFNQNINSWDTSNVISMNGMFSSTLNFNQPLNNWSTSNVITFEGMFSEAVVFNQNIGSWNTSNAITFSKMFSGAVNFDQDLGNWNVENLLDATAMFSMVTLSVANYDSLLIGWNAQNLQPNVPFDGGLSKYCIGEPARTNMISIDNWNIQDGGYGGTIVNDLTDQTNFTSFTFPLITGVNLTGSETYFTGPNGSGTVYNAGDTINYADFPSYPVTLYIYDFISPGCYSEESFQLIITPPLSCTSLSDPLDGATGVLVDTDLFWNASATATGYVITVGTSSGGTDILNALDVGNVLTYDLASDLPDDVTIYVSIVPYNADGSAIGCSDEKFTTEDILYPPDCTSLSDPLDGATGVLVDTDLFWNASATATGYVITVGASSGGTDILNALDVGNVLTYDLASDLPDDTTIYVSIVPYNADGSAIGCSEESFTTEDILYPPDCTSLSDPLDGATGVLVDTDLFWNASATGYVITVGTSSGGTDILNALDVGNVLTYDLAIDLPDDVTIYVSIVPYNADGSAIGCLEESFTTEDILYPPDCTTLSDPLDGATGVLVGTDLSWNVSATATGYVISVGTTSGGTDILNALDVGNVLTYDLAGDLP